jgi:hypothetical protein
MIGGLYRCLHGFKHASGEEAVVPVERSNQAPLIRWGEWAHLQIQTLDAQKIHSSGLAARQEVEVREVEYAGGDQDDRLPLSL